jgi:hypothetical protein
MDRIAGLAPYHINKGRAGFAFHVKYGAAEPVLKHQFKENSCSAPGIQQYKHNIKTSLNLLHEFISKHTTLPKKTYYC